MMSAAILMVRNVASICSRPLIPARISLVLQKELDLLDLDLLRFLIFQPFGAGSRIFYPHRLYLSRASRDRAWRREGAKIQARC